MPPDISESLNTKLLALSYRLPVSIAVEYFLYWLGLNGYSGLDGSRFP